MTVTLVVLWTFAVVLAIFGFVFVLLGMNSERTYWSQRDPNGDAANDATALRTVVAHAGRYATGEYRAPLRITAIGVLVVGLGAAFAIVALLVGLL